MKNNLRYLRSQKAFTLVEVIVVIAIISILSVIAIPSFSEVRLQFALSRATYRFAQDLRRAQNMALSGVKYKDQSGQVQPISGYGVYINKDTLGDKKYVIYANQSSGNQEYDDFDYAFDTVDFSSSESGVIISEIKNVVTFNNISINFEPPNPNTVIMPLNQSSIDIIFALESDLTNFRTVSINTAGLIEVK